MIPLLRPALSGAVVACVVSLAATAATQDQRTTFGVTTRLVQVNVIVHDKDGQPVADLAAGDFRLYEDGKEQAIESFSVESTIAAVARESPASRGDFGNRLRGPAGGGVTVILLDRLNTRFEDQTLARAQIVRFIGRLQPQDRVALYIPVDARGLVGAFAGNPSALSSTSTRNTDQALRNVFTTMSTTRPNIEALQTIAENTGGRAFYETNDITRALSRAVDDSRVTYVLGYSPSQGKWDGSFHKIEVKVRRPGVEVRHRKGYLALPAPRLDPTKRQAALLDAVRSGLEATGIGLTAHVEKGAAPGQLDVALRLDPASVALQKVGERWEGAFDLAIMQGLAGGSLFPSLETTVELRLTDDLRARMLKQGLVVNRKVPLRDDALALHIAARDSTTGATGSLIIPAGRLRDATAQ
ncbi:MAG TPA: VWA domain-containing protein [Vicinamibacteria bacterium]